MQIRNLVHPCYVRLFYTYAVEDASGVAGISFDILMTGYEVIGDEYLIFLDGSCGILKEIHNFNDEKQFF